VGRALVGAEAALLASATGLMILAVWLAPKGRARPGG